MILKSIYIKYRIEGWIEVYNEHFNGMSLESLAYEMTEGGGICTSMVEIKRTNDHNDLDGGAEDFFECEDEE